MNKKWSDPNLAPIVLPLLFIIGILGASAILVLLDFIFNLGLS